MVCQEHVSLDFRHLQERIKEFSGEDVSREGFIERLRHRLATADIENVKQDVFPYIAQSQRRELDIWSNEYFLNLADRIKFL